MQKIVRGLASWAAGLSILGCSAAPQPPQHPSSRFQSIAAVVLSAAPVTDPNEIHYWASVKDFDGKGFDEIVSMNIGCLAMIKPECRTEMMLVMMGYYEKWEGRPYLFCIIENWMRVLPRRPVVMNHLLSIPNCEDAWQWGDLNADCIVNYEDLAIYSAVAK